MTAWSLNCGHLIEARWIIRPEYCVIPAEVECSKMLNSLVTVKTVPCGLELCSERPPDTETFDGESDKAMDRPGFEYLIECCVRISYAGKAFAWISGMG